MTETERKLAAALLDMAAGVFDNHGCNDLDAHVLSLLSVGEWDALTREYHDYNGDPEEYDFDYPIHHDAALMSFMAHKLRSTP